MVSLPQLEVQRDRLRRVPFVVAILALALLAAAIALTTFQVRSAIRDQIVGRDGAILQAVAQTQLDEIVSETSPDFLGEAPDLLTVALKASRLKGVLATRLMDPNGRFVEAFPVSAREADLAPADLEAMRRFEPLSRFHPELDPRVIFYPGPESGAPLAVMAVLEVNVPVRDGLTGPLLGIAQFLIEGHSVAAEFRRLDQHLAYQAATAFAASGALLVFALAWAFRRLQRANRLLSERTSHLARAHQELALAAKTSAVGALAFHLIHGLKSPLAGLQQWVSESQRDRGQSEGADWEQAAASARRMQTLIQDVVNVLREEESSAQYELSLSELAEVVERRVKASALARGVHLVSDCAGDPVLDNRTANLVAFILVNLLENAFAASPVGSQVELRARPIGEAIVWTVRDEGSGFPAAFRAEPFAPRQSTKQGGSGIGLAISKQLAGHLGARLELKATSAAGSILELEVPLRRSSG